MPETSDRMDGSPKLPRPEGERVGVRGLRRSKFAKTLRTNLTDAERKLWYRLRDRRLGGLKFKRQAPIGHFVVDFVCPEHHLVIELDGGQHGHEERAMRDRDRSAQLEAMGYLVLRFWNAQVLKDMDGVLTEILGVLDRLDVEPPHPNPLPAGERES